MHGHDDDALAAPAPDVDPSSTDGDGPVVRRRARLVARLAAAGVDTSPWWGARLRRVCVVALSEVGVDGAGVTVMASISDGLAGHRDQICATDALARRLEDLQLTTGEGPCLEAFRSGAPVLVGDLVAEPARWLGFGPEAVAAGAAAVFSLPLQVGAVRLGTLDLHRTVAGALDPEQFADALELASLATECLLELALDPDQGAPDGSEPDGATRGGRPPRSAGPAPTMGWLPHVHAAVHRASGMVAAREHIGVGEALLWLRAYAFAHGEPVNQVAQRVIDRDLVLPGPATTTTRPDPRTGLPPARPDAETDP